MTTLQYNNAIQLDMNVLAEFASAPENAPCKVIDITSQPTTFIGRITRLFGSTFGTGNTLVYSVCDTENKV